MPYKDRQKQKESQARYYQENKDAVSKARNSKRSLLRRYLQEYKEKYPCVDCGINYPYYVMEFDHLPEFEKSFNIGTLGNSETLQSLKDEIAKCELVCSNCHRHRTFMRKVKL